jgi:DNA-binding transcriptional LysR family regulator
VTITASIGVTALWLLPRLGRLQARLPDIDLRVAANDKVLDLRAEGIDLGIRYCPRERAPAGALHLFDEIVVPVAHPALAARPSPMLRRSPTTCCSNSTGRRRRSCSGARTCTRRASTTRGRRACCASTSTIR